MTAPGSDGLTFERNEVFRLFGQCILQLQHYEISLKSLIAAHRISIPASAVSEADIERARTNRVAQTNHHTLGTLIGEMTGSFLASDVGQDAVAASERLSAVDIRMGITLPPEDFAQTTADLRDLVVLRNFLVHHFLEQHDLGTLSGCLTAQRVLMDSLERVGQAHSDLCSWAEGMSQAREAMALYLQTGEFQDLIFKRASKT
ncbi:hypothetical protein [Fuscibacter oryzae]|uniref:Uncharacterized protein n=1 Tax=Fuscibacter oryzae TaxID=2803939 RepID=A0A8J7MLR3_9RHOB|nr:hypothetical protein [Fuscibacter oryzae]MBL4926487.1 hypothetical protein [Fuscibacter oryzae]